MSQPSRHAIHASAAGTCLLLAMATSGCAVFGMPDQLAETQAQVADLQRRHQALVQQLESLRRLHDEERELLRAMQASQSTQSDELTRRIENLAELFRHSSREIDRLARLSRSGAPIAAGAGAAPDTVKVPVVEGERLYDAAYSNLQQGRYPLAIMEFREYLRRFPDGELADNSQYGIGESYYAQAEYETAAAAFLEVPERFPDSDLARAALLKAGLAFAELGRLDRARAYLDRVIDEYPYSDEAIRARDRLRRLGG